MENDDERAYLGKEIPLETTVQHVKRSDFLLNFFCYQYTGFEILTMPDPALGLSPREIYNDRQWPRDAAGGPLYHRPIKDRDGIKAGDRVVWKCTPLDYIYGEGVIVADGDGFRVETPNGALLGSLEFGKDDRGCWVCGCVGSTKALEQIDFA